MHLKSRSAKVGDKLTSGRIPGDTLHHTYGTKGLFDEGETGTAVCLLPGTEVAFARDPVKFLGLKFERKPAVATFRQINKDNPCTHHDALEFADGSVRLVHHLEQGQKMTVLQLPAAPKTADEAKEQERLEVVA
jgi:hypothetical protein